MILFSCVIRFCYRLLFYSCYSFFLTTFSLSGSLEIIPGCTWVKAGSITSLHGLIWAFGTLLKSTSADLWDCSCSPYNQNTSHVLPTSGLEPAPSASQPSTLQAELPLFLISVFELQYGIFYSSKWYLGYKHDFTKSVQFRSFSNTSHIATKQCPPPSVSYCAAPKLFTKVPSIVVR